MLVFTYDDKFGYSYLGWFCKKVREVLRAATKHDSVSVNGSALEHDGDVGHGGVVEVGLEQRRRTFEDRLVCHLDVCDCRGAGVRLRCRVWWCCVEVCFLSGSLRKVSSSRQKKCVGARRGRMMSRKLGTFTSLSNWNTSNSDGGSIWREVTSLNLVYQKLCCMTWCTASYGTDHLTSNANITSAPSLHTSYEEWKILLLNRTKFASLAFSTFPSHRRHPNCSVPPT